LKTYSIVQGDATVLKPTVMCAVPLVLDRIYKGIKTNIKKKGEFTSLLMDFCYNYRSF
jgi:long-chain acyl-CoA synthetase